MHDYKSRTRLRASSLYSALSVPAKGSSDPDWQAHEAPQGVVEPLLRLAGNLEWFDALGRAQ
jgi:hypothetical protein